MRKKPTYPPEDKIALYDQLVASHPDIVRKGKTSPYTSVNGHMFSYLSKTGTAAIRLPKTEREAFLEKYDTTLDEQYGAVMKEYVQVPDHLLQDIDALKPYLTLSFEYVKSLKPKPTKRKKKT
ncbi:MAG: hypothetical protein AAF629_08515 [Chloroflexota bacterium]